MVKRGLAAFWLSGFLALSGCSGPEPVAVATAEATSAPGLARIEDGRAIIMPAGLDVVPVISNAAGAPWEAQPFIDNESWTGGSVNLYRRNVLYPAASTVVDRTKRGSIYMVQVRSGTLNKCGEGEPLERALNALLISFQKQPLRAEQLAGLRKVWQDRSGDFEVVTDGLLIRAVGKCVNTLVAKAV